MGMGPCVCVNFVQAASPFALHPVNNDMSLIIFQLDTENHREKSLPYYEPFDFNMQYILY